MRTMPAQFKPIFAPLLRFSGLMLLHLNLNEVGDHILVVTH